jgi:hypothetical protein
VVDAVVLGVGGGVWRMFVFAQATRNKKSLAAVQLLDALKVRSIFLPVVGTGKHWHDDISSVSLIVPLLAAEHGQFHVVMGLRGNSLCFSSIRSSGSLIAPA